MRWPCCPHTAEVEMNIPKQFRRQVQLAEVGEEGQNRLLGSTAVIVGVGGLGCPSALYLAACGVGELVIVDFDVVQDDNLNRQVLFSPADIGKSKAECAARFLESRYPHTRITAVNARFSAEMALNLFEKAQVILDCTDELSNRYLTDDVCHIYGKPWIYASLNKFSFQTGLMLPAAGQGYRSLFPQPPNPLTLPTCARDGILGTTAGMAGTAQAALALQQLLGLGEKAGFVQHCDTRSGETYKLAISTHNDLKTPEMHGVLTYNYQQFCNQFH